MVSLALVVVVVASSPVEQQVGQLEEIIKLSGRQPELLFRLADLWMEQSRSSLLEGDEAHSADAAKKGIALFAELSQEHADFARADEVLYFLGKALLDTGDERRAAIAFHRLTERHPTSRFVAEAHFALGEFLFAKSNGRRDWLSRALASYVAASGAESPVRSDALYKQGWCLLNLDDFDGAMTRFREVVKTGGPRATDAERDFVRAYERGGGKATEAPSVFAALTTSEARARQLTELLARSYRDDGFDAEAALTWQSLIRAQPRAKETLGYQRELIEALVRMGRRPLVVAQVQRLVKMAAELPAGDVGGAEPLLASLATSWHSECRKTKADGCLAGADAVYEAYLGLFPTAPRAYELRFFHAELLFEAGEFARAATAYRTVVDRDIACREGKQCAPGKFLEPAAWGEIQARDAIARAEVPHQGCAPASRPLLAAR